MKSDVKGRKKKRKAKKRVEGGAKNNNTLKKKKKKKKKRKTAKSAPGWCDWVILGSLLAGIFTGQSLFLGYPYQIVSRVPYRSLYGGRLRTEGEGTHTSLHSCDIPGMSIHAEEEEEKKMLVLLSITKKKKKRRLGID